MLWHSKSLDMLNFEKKNMIWICHVKFSEKRPSYWVKNELRKLILFLLHGYLLHYLDVKQRSMYKNKQDQLAGHSWHKNSCFSLGHKKFKSLSSSQTFNMAKFFECQSIYRRWEWSKILTRTWLKSNQKISRTWRLSLYTLKSLL